MGQLLWPVLAIVVFASIALTVLLLAKRYVKVPPEKALVLSGRGGTHIVTGGAKLVLPVLYDYYYLDLTAFEFPVKLNGVQDKNRVEISLDAVVVCKIPNDENMIKTAAANLGRKDAAQIKQIAHSAFEGHVRSSIGKMTVSEMISEREKLSQTIKSEAEPELAKLGIGLITLNFKELNDSMGYIKALGAQETAKVLADARIIQADHERRATTETTTSQREAAKVKAENEGKIADANRDLQMKQANYTAQIEKEKATAAQAGPLASAEAQKAVVRAQVAVQQEKVEAEITLQGAIAKKTEAELGATVLKQADAEKQRLLIVAEGDRAASIVRAEGEQKRVTIEAQGTADAKRTTAQALKESLKLEGEGQAAKTLAAGEAAATVAEKTGKAEASATEARMLADAKGRTAQADASRALLLAEADGTKAKGLAEAAGVEAQLLAQATGMKELMSAYYGLSGEQKQLLQLKWTLEALPGIVDKLGDAGEKIMSKIAESVTASLASIDTLTVYDSGSGNSGGNAIERTMKMAPNALLDMINMLKATGMGPVVAGLLNKAGVDISGLTGDEKTNAAGA